MTTILSFKDLMAILFYNMELVIYTFYQFLSFDRIHYIVSKNSSCQTLTNHLDGVISLRTALYWHGLLDSSTQSLGCSTLYKIIVVIFKFINFVDDFKSFNLVWIEEHVYKTSTWPLGTNEYISPFLDCYPLHILNVLFWSTRVNAWD